MAHDCKESLPLLRGLPIRIRVPGALAPKTPSFGNFTTFAEFYATSILDGSNPATEGNFTPGIRFTLGHGNVLMAGVDLPLSHPHDFDATYRLTYVLNF